MEAFAMNTPTLYLDCVILASTTYPSGLSYSLFYTWKKDVGGVSTGLLALLTLPYLAVIPAVWFLVPGLLVLRGTTLPMLAAAVLVAPPALVIEYLVTALLEYQPGVKFARKLTIQRDWRDRFSFADQSLLVLVAVGEEVFYRMIWLHTMMLLGLGAPLAVAVSSLAYGINHLGFGWNSVVSKSVTGCIYAALYLLGRESIWLPIVAHILQNFLLFQITRRQHA
jgi:CAAX protease family protein